MDFNPSKDWALDERVAVAAEIAGEVHERLAGGFVPSNLLLEYMERIGFVLKASASFLEANRQKILEGGVSKSGPKEAEPT